MKVKRQLVERKRYIGVILLLFYYSKEPMKVAFHFIIFRMIHLVLRRSLTVKISKMYTSCADDDETRYFIY